MDHKEKLISKLQKWLQNEEYSDGERNIINCIISELEDMQPDDQNIPNDDAINRQMAIQGIKECFSMGKGFSDELSLIKMLENLPTESPDWIPVEKELPQDGFPCLATIHVNNPLYGEITGVYQETVGYDGEKWYNSDGSLQCEVIAWMRLPKPFN